MSTLKVDTIQTSAGATPSLSDLGINQTGTVLGTGELKVAASNGTNLTSFTPSSYTSYQAVDATDYVLTYTPVSTTSKLLVQMRMNRFSNNGANQEWFNLSFGVYYKYNGSTSPTSYTRIEEYVRYIAHDTSGTSFNSWIRDEIILDAWFDHGAASGESISFTPYWKVEGGSNGTFSTLWIGYQSEARFRVIEMEID